jgi:peroxiredoxin Q/BCP
MNTPTIGKLAPAFTLPATGNQKIALRKLKGQNVVLYFYPRDATPGCTSESQDFRDAKKKFDRLNTVILGISQDSIESHEKFATKQSLNFDLLSDESGTVCRKYDVIKMKNMYGKKFEGIERSTFLIDEKGVLRQEWRKVKVAGHVDAVLAAVKALS